MRCLSGIFNYGSTACREIVVCVLVRHEICLEDAAKIPPFLEQKSSYRSYPVYNIYSNKLPIIKRTYRKTAKYDIDVYWRPSDCNFPKSLIINYNDNDS